MHHVGTVPTFKMHHVGTVPTYKMHHVGTIKKKYVVKVAAIETDIEDFTNVTPDMIRREITEFI